MLRFVRSLRFCAATFPMLFGWNFGVSPMLKNVVPADLTKVWVFDDSRKWFTLTEDETGIVPYDGPKGTKTNPINISVPSGITSLPAGIFDDTYINVLVIPPSMQTINHPYALRYNNSEGGRKFFFLLKENFPRN